MKFIVACLAVLAVGCYSILGSVVTVVEASATGNVGRTTDSLANFTYSLNGIVGQVTCALDNLLNNAVEPAVDMAQELVDAVSSALNEIVAQINGLTPLAEHGITDVLDAKVSNVGNALFDVISSAGCFFDDFAGQVNELLPSLDVLLYNLLCAVQDLIATVVAAVADLLNQVNKDIDRAVAQLQLALKPLINIVYETLAGLLKKLQDLPVGCALNEHFDELTCIVNELLCRLTILAENIIDDVREALRNLSDKLEEILGTLVASLGNLGLECPC